MWPDRVFFRSCPADRTPARQPKPALMARVSLVGAVVRDNGRIPHQWPLKHTLPNFARCRRLQGH